MLLGEPYKKVRAMNKTIFEEGLEKGLERGLEEGLKAMQNTLVRLGSKRLGQPTEEMEVRIRAIPDLARLEALTDRILDAGSWEDLLKEN